MTSFTDQKQRLATEEDLQARWSGAGPGERFRCYLCGHKFQLGDLWRWVCSRNKTVSDINGFVWMMPNFLVCNDCDGDDVLDRWVELNQEYFQKFWWKEEK